MSLCVFKTIIWLCPTVASMTSQRAHLPTRKHGCCIHCTTFEILPVLFGTSLSAQPLEGVGLGQARIRDDLGTQFDGQVNGLVALWKLAVVQQRQQLGQSHLRWEGLTL